MKNEKLIAAWNNANPREAAVIRIFDRIQEKQNSTYHIGKTVLKKAVALASMAVVICLAVTGVMYLTARDSSGAPESAHLNEAVRDAADFQHGGVSISSNVSPSQAEAGAIPIQQGDNNFVLLAYTFEPQQDGTVVLRETEILDRDISMRGFPLTLDKYENGVYFSGVGMICNGNNIAGVEFTVNEGVFGKLSKSGLVKWQSDAEALLGYNNDEVDILGNCVYLSKDDITGDTVLMWCIENLYDIDRSHREIIIKARATFTDNNIAEQIVFLDFSPEAIIEREKLYRIAGLEYLERLEYYRSIPLDECELVPDSVQQVSHVYQYNFKPTEETESGLSNPGIVWVNDNGFANGREGFEFDENGLMVAGYSDTFGDDLDRGCIFVIKLEDDGTTTGMLFRPPLKESVENTVPGN